MLARKSGQSKQHSDILIEIAEERARLENKVVKDKKANLPIIPVITAATSTSGLTNNQRRIWRRRAAEVNFMEKQLTAPTLHSPGTSIITFGDQDTQSLAASHDDALVIGGFQVQRVLVDNGAATIYSLGNTSLDGIRAGQFNR